MFRPQAQFKQKLTQEKLISLFKTNENFSLLIDGLQADRLTQSNNSFELLEKIFNNELKDENYVKDFKVNENLAQTDPLLFILLSLIIEKNQNIDSALLRDKAANAYKRMYDDEQFEHHYFYSKSPLPVLAHLLMSAKVWKNDQNKEFYDEQMMGIYKGSLSFNPGGIISKEILQIIQNKESESHKGWPYPFHNALEPQPEGNFKVIKWASTPEMDDGLDARLDRLYIKARRAKQIEILDDYINQLNLTSQMIAQQFSTQEKNVLLVIGPYGSGKTTYINHFFGVKEHRSTLISLSVDSLNEFFREAHKDNQASRSDFHFEAAIIKDKIDNSKINNLFATGAFIDSYRFNRALDREHQGRNIKVIEIATEMPEIAVACLCIRENIKDLSNKIAEAALTSANDVQINRKERINKVLNHQGKNNVEYELICNRQINNDKSDFVSVCSIQRDKLVVNDDVVYQNLISSRVATKEEVGKMIDQKESSFKKKM